MKYFRVGVMVLLAAVSAVSLLGCSENAGGPKKEITAKSLQGDPSHMPANARQAVADAQAKGNQAATAGKDSVKK